MKTILLLLSLVVVLVALGVFAHGQGTVVNQDRILQELGSCTVRLAVTDELLQRQAAELQRKSDELLALKERLKKYEPEK